MNIQIKGTAPESPILTSNGYKEIQSISESDNVWNGSNFVPVKVEKSSGHVKLLKVKTDNGFEQDFTEDQVWYVVDERSVVIKTKTTKELRIGDKLMEASYPVIQGEKKMHKAYINGYNGGKHHYNSGWSVPGVVYDIDTRVKWLSGIIDARGSLFSYNTSSMLKISCLDYQFLREIQFMLHTIGISSSLKEAGYGKEYKLVLNDYALFRLKQIGVTPCRINLTSGTRPINILGVRILSVEDSGRKDSAYAIVDTKLETMICGGILTGV